MEPRPSVRPHLALPPSAAHFVDGNQRWLACAVSIALLMALHAHHGVVKLPYDSAEYWDLARITVFFEYASPRGYLFPLLLVPVRWIGERLGDPVGVLRLSLSLIYGVALPLLVPVAYQLAFGGKVTFWRRLVPVVLLALIFPGLLIYPLSDLPALLMALAALWLALRALQAGGWRQWGLWWLAGNLAGAAYNTRTIYMLAVLVLLLLAACVRRQGADGFLRRLLAVMAVVAGIVTVLVPQLVFNRLTHGVSTLAVRPIVENRSIFANQLVWGLTLQRYESTLAPEARQGANFYLDPAGERLFKAMAAEGNLFSMRHYASSVLANPLSFAALYGRHVVSGLDVRDGVVYTRKPSPARHRTAAFNFIVLLLSTWVLAAAGASRGAWQDAGFHAPSPAWPFALLLLLLPVAAVVPGAIETRFFVPLHLLAYASLACWFDAGALLRFLGRRWLAVGFVSLLLAATFFSVSLATMSRFQQTWPDLYRYGPAGPSR